MDEYISTINTLFVNLARATSGIESESIQQCIRILFPPVSSGVIFHFLDDNHLATARWKLSIVFVCIFLVAKHVEDFFHVCVHLESIYSVHFPIWLDYLLF